MKNLDIIKVVVAVTLLTVGALGFFMAYLLSAAGIITASAVFITSLVLMLASFLIGCAD